MAVGRDGGEPSAGPMGGATGDQVTNSFKHRSDVIRLALTIILEKSLWL